MSTWREERNEAARVRLLRRGPEALPPPVLAHALRQPLMPPTPRRATESYWRAHILLADRLARALAARSGAPEGWSWRLDAREGATGSFRMPPAPYREAEHDRGPGHCCVCGQPVYRLGWHADVFGDGKVNRNATWHAACAAAWKLWLAPTDHIKLLKRRQKHRCGVTGKRLLKTSEVDHAVPLFRVWAEHRDEAWPLLLAYWGAPNLQVINRAAHVEKCAREAGERAAGSAAARADGAIVIAGETA